MNNADIRECLLLINELNNRKEYSSIKKIIKDNISVTFKEVDEVLKKTRNAYN